MSIRTKKTMKLAAGLASLAAVGTMGLGNAFAANYTLAQVAGHATAADCWLAINSKVYNVTSFLSLHSGGSAVIIAACGTDATAVFNSGPHSASTIAALAPYLLGDLVANNPVLTSVTVSPATPTIGVGGTVQLTASPKDQYGTAFPGATVTWSSNSTGTATVGGTGLVTAVALGTTTVTATATSGEISVTGSAAVTVSAVTPPPPPPAQNGGDDEDERGSEHEDQERGDRGHGDQEHENREHEDGHGDHGRGELSRIRIDAAVGVSVQHAERDDD